MADRKDCSESTAPRVGESAVGGDDRMISAPLSAAAAAGGRRKKRSDRLEEAHRAMEEARAARELTRREESYLERRIEEARRRGAEAEEEYRRAAEKVFEAELLEPCRWNDMYRELLRYKEEHGHCLVPHRSPDDPELNRLGRWVANQRVFYKMHHNGKPGHIKPHRIQALDKIGFVWSTYDNQWSERYEELKAYKAKSGDCNVPQKYPDAPKLVSWVEVQRRNYRDMMADRPTDMTPERKRKLDDLGFPWMETARRVGSCKKIRVCAPKKPLRPTPEESDELFERGYRELAAFREEHGDCRVNGRVRKHSASLTKFVAWQRKQYQKFVKGEPSQLTPERVLRLENLGFEWTVNTRRRPEFSGDGPKRDDGDSSEAVRDSAGARNEDGGAVDEAGAATSSTDDSKFVRDAADADAKSVDEDEAAASSTARKEHMKDV